MSAEVAPHQSSPLLLLHLLLSHLIQKNYSHRRETVLIGTFQNSRLFLHLTQQVSGPEALRTVPTSSLEVELHPSEGLFRDCSRLF